VLSSNFTNKTRQFYKISYTVFELAIRYLIKNIIYLKYYII